MYKRLDDINFWQINKINKNCLKFNENKNKEVFMI